MHCYPSSSDDLVAFDLSVLDPDWFRHFLLRWPSSAVRKVWSSLVISCPVHWMHTPALVTKLTWLQVFDHRASAAASYLLFPNLLSHVPSFTEITQAAVPSPLTLLQNKQILAQIHLEWGAIWWFRMIIYSSGVQLNQWRSLLTACSVLFWMSCLLSNSLISGRLPLQYTDSN